LKGGLIRYVISTPPPEALRPKTQIDADVPAQSPQPSLSPLTPKVVPSLVSVKDKGKVAWVWERGDRVVGNGVGVGFVSGIGVDGVLLEVVF
jgi:hypothetical protein